MKKNIHVVFGLDNLRKQYLHEIKDDKTKDDSIYITIDDIFKATGIIVFDVPFNNSDRIHYFLKNNDFLSQHSEYLNSIIKPDLVSYLISEFKKFLIKSISKLSISQTLKKRENYQEIRKNNQTNDFQELMKINKYSDYKAAFLAKNIMYSKENNSNTCKQLYDEYNNKSKSSPFNTSEYFEMSNYSERASKPFINYSLYRNHDIANNEHMTDAFDSFLENDLKGFSYIKELRDKISHEKKKGYRRTEEEEKLVCQGDVIAYSFERAFIRKLSKLSIDWLESEADKCDSPIKDIIIYMKDVPSWRENLNNSIEAGDHNINIKNFHHKWRKSGYKDIGNFKNHSPIAYSEIRYALNIMSKKKNHHIKLSYVDTMNSKEDILKNL